MPAVSKAQARAMFAAAAGKSTLGIPEKVGAEFVGAGHGKSMKGLPEHVKSMRLRKAARKAKGGKR